MNEFEYYLLDRKNSPSYPAFDFKDASDKKIFFQKDSINSVVPIKMCLHKPFPRKIEFVDFHNVASILAFGQKLYDVLEPLKLHKVQLIPATVEVKKGEALEGCYWLMHSYARIECMDLEKSDCEIDKYGDVVWIRKIVLSQEKLAKIPLKERLFFRMKEDFPTHLVHKSVVDKMLAISPEGLRFTPAEKWKQGMQFDLD